MDQPQPEDVQRTFGESFGFVPANSPSGSDTETKESPSGVVPASGACDGSAVKRTALRTEETVDCVDKSDELEERGAGNTVKQKPALESIDLFDNQFSEDGSLQITNSEFTRSLRRQSSTALPPVVEEESPSEPSISSMASSKSDSTKRKNWKLSRRKATPSGERAGAEAEPDDAVVVCLDVDSPPKQTSKQQEIARDDLVDPTSSPAKGEKMSVDKKEVIVSDEETENAATSKFAEDETLLLADDDERGTSLIRASPQSEKKRVSPSRNDSKSGKLVKRRRTDSSSNNEDDDKFHTHEEKTTDSPEVVRCSVEDTETNKSEQKKKLRTSSRQKTPVPEKDESESEEEKERPKKRSGVRGVRGLAALLGMSPLTRNRASPKPSPRHTPDNTDGGDCKVTTVREAKKAKSDDDVLSETQSPEIICDTPVELATSPIKQSTPRRRRESGRQKVTPLKKELKDDETQASDLVPPTPPKSAGKLNNSFHAREEKQEPRDETFKTPSLKNTKRQQVFSPSASLEEDSESLFAAIKPRQDDEVDEMGDKQDNQAESPGNFCADLRQI